MAPIFIELTDVQQLEADFLHHMSPTSHNNRACIYSVTQRTLLKSLVTNFIQIECFMYRNMAEYNLRPKEKYGFRCADFHYSPVLQTSKWRLQQVKSLKKNET
jgi:hypothetical protein